MDSRDNDQTFAISRRFQAAEQDDLWRFLTEQAHKDNKLSKDVTVKDIMDTWTLQMGFPVVNVQRNYETNTATVSQVRLFPGSTFSLINNEPSNPTYLGNRNDF